MKRLAGVFGLASVFFAQQALAATAYLMVFLDEAPLSGVEVRLDGDSLGNTDFRGSATAALAGGDHVITLIDDDLEFPISFSAANQDEVEIKVSFTSAAGDEPRVSIRKFGPGDVGTNGYVTGQVTDGAGTPVAGATIAALGTQFSAQTDDDGVYVLQIPRGEYDLQVSGAGFQTATLPGLRVLADVGVTAGVTLTSEGAAGVVASPQLEEVFVLGVFNPTDTAAGVERYATSITSAIDVEQLQRFGDSDVAAALNRAVGVAVVDRSYATVRGLDGRYISATLNGLLMPSTDPLRRDVQLDLFPTLIVGGIEIQKSYTPDKLATTTGGAIRINTKGLPDEQIHQVGGSLGWNTEFTGDDILNYESSNDDWLGYDSGLRDLPGGVLAATDGGRSLTVCDPAIDPVRCTAPIEAARLGVRFQDDWNVRTKDALPDFNASWAYGDRHDVGENEWGYYLAADYDRETKDRGDAELTNPLETEGEYMRSRETTAITGYGAIGYEYGAANEFMSKSIFLHNTDDTTRLEEGVDNLEGNVINSAILEWVEREFISQAFTGHNEFDVDYGTHLLDWRAAYSRTKRDEPDRRQYTYFNGFLSTSTVERRWSDLEEDSVDLGVDYAFVWDWGDISSTEFQAGILWSDKDRDVDQYRFGIGLGDRGDDLDLSIEQDLEKDILPYQNYALDRVRLTAITSDTDSYESEEEIQAYYFNTVTELGESWTLLAGARFEDFDQTLDYPNDPDSSSELQYDDWYPAFNVTWRWSEELQFRFGYSETVSYPGLIERSEAQSFDPDTDDPIFGNPNLKVSTIDNYDVRAEYYFSDNESVSLALFYKDITDPVERAVPDASGSAARGITFVNQDDAELFGVELDANKDIIVEDDYLVFIAGNVSYIDSEVSLSEDSLRLEGENADGRELQGQSEWLYNIQVGYDHYPTEQKVTLLVNFFDDRIFRISRGQNTGPEYEEARTIVDITYENMINENFTLEAKVQNLFNEKVEYSQNGRTIESYEVG